MPFVWGGQRQVQRYSHTPSCQSLHWSHKEQHKKPGKYHTGLPQSRSSSLKTPAWGWTSSSTTSTIAWRQFLTIKTVLPNQLSCPALSKSSSFNVFLQTAVRQHIIFHSTVVMQTATEPFMLVVWSPLTFKQIFHLIWIQIDVTNALASQTMVIKRMKCQCLPMEVMQMIQHKVYTPVGSVVVHLMFKDRNNVTMDHMLQLLLWWIPQKAVAEYLSPLTVCCFSLLKIEVEGTPIHSYE